MNYDDYNTYVLTKHEVKKLTNDLKFITSTAHCKVFMLLKHKYGTVIDPVSNSIVLASPKGMYDKCVRNCISEMLMHGHQTEYKI
jgi:hypothetical protein